MEIPEQCFSLTFQRRLKQYVYKLLMKPLKFPRFSYDDDLIGLSEEILQESYKRVHGKRWDGKRRNEAQWFQFFCGFVRNIVHEESRETFNREKAIGKKITPLTHAEEAQSSAPPAETLVASSEQSIQVEYENKQLNQIFEEELAAFSHDPFFRYFARRQWFDEEKGRHIWEQRGLFGSPDGELQGLSTYFKWYKKLLLSVLERWDPSRIEVRRTHGKR